MPSLDEMDLPQPVAGRITQRARRVTFRKILQGRGGTAVILGSQARQGRLIGCFVVHSHRRRGRPRRRGGGRLEHGESTVDILMQIALLVT